MDARCREALVSEQAKRAKDIGFNPILKRDCEKDLQDFEKKKLCGDMKGQGARINCLTANVKIIQGQECLQAVKKLMQLHSADLRAKPGMQDVCEQDIKELCPGVEPGQGRRHQCLREHNSSIKSQACKAMVEAVMEQEAGSASVNFQVRSLCKSEMAKFC